MTPPLPRRRRWTEHFVTGLFILAPAYVTFLVVRFIVGQINRIFSPLFRWLDPYLTSAWADLVAHAGTLVIFVVAVTVIGWGTKILVLRRIFGAVEDRLVRLPMVGKIYAGMREMAQVFGAEHKSMFSRVVLVEWPGKGRYAIGFVTQEGTGEVQAKTPEQVVNIFVPTTPNPTSGFLILADREALIPLEMSVEEGLKLVISGGVVGPPVSSPAPGPSTEDSRR
ncbi:MAG: hypothetical protein A3C53_08195 [Omnitrophica WOR_2 bacterium RIFCSPHIGHO2_02_FULL_68_15]|nr:MAG: hypothetical protein A3C53_08195 [Omnitrophica WOR_2 bacterium RIFCSPHIGHO2_02_FULL_68_15]